jgi:hypothetical protein
MPRRGGGNPCSPIPTPTGASLASQPQSASPIISSKFSVARQICEQHLCGADQADFLFLTGVYAPWLHPLPYPLKGL